MLEMQLKTLHPALEHVTFDGLVEPPLHFQLHVQLPHVLFGFADSRAAPCLAHLHTLLTAHALVAQTAGFYLPVCVSGFGRDFVL